MKNNFPFRTHWKKPEEPKAAPETSQYLPRAVELTVEQHKPEEGLRVLLEGLRITSTARRRPWGHTRWQIPQC